MQLLHGENCWKAFSWSTSPYCPRTSAVGTRPMDSMDECFRKMLSQNSPRAEVAFSNICQSLKSKKNFKKIQKNYLFKYFYVKCHTVRTGTLCAYVVRSYLYKAAAKNKNSWNWCIAHSGLIWQNTDRKRKFADFYSAEMSFQNSSEVTWPL